MINDVFEDFCKKKVFFSIGRDNKFRPVVYLYPTRLQSHLIPGFQYFVNVYLSIIQKYVFRPYHIENWVMIIDVEKKGVLNFPYKAIKSLIEATDLNFSSRLHRTFIVNPSFLFNTAWTFIKSFIDQETTRKMSVLTKKDFGQILEVIPKSQLLKEYGGDMESPVSAFPIKKTLNDDAMPKLTELERNSNNLIEQETKNETKLPNSKYSYITNADSELHVVASETRSLTLFGNQSFFSKEMTRIAEVSFKQRTN